MNREEEIVRSTMAALASTVTQIRPLRMTEAAAELDRSAPPAGPAGPGRAGRPRAAWRWRTWAAPVAAAALIIGLAVALVVVRNMPGAGHATPVAPANCALPHVSQVTRAGAAPSGRGAPPYYAEVVACGGKATAPSGLVVGDTLTGKVIATIAPPAGTSFLSISAAADDRTFAVFATPVGAGPTVAGWWYLLRLAPGTSSPARLTRIPVKPMSDVAETALSGSGRELAVGLAYNAAGTPWLGVYSVATGRLLRSWSAHGAQPFRIEGWGVSFFSGNNSSNPQSSSMTWVQGDRAIMFWAVSSGGGADLRRLDLAGGGSDIVKDSQSVWPSTANRACTTPTLVSADGKTVICADNQDGARGWTARWLAYSITAPATPVLRYQLPNDSQVSSMITPWVSSSGAVMIVEWLVQQPSAHGPRIGGFGLVSQGKFTPLKQPPTSDTIVAPAQAAW